MQVAYHRRASFYFNTCCTGWFGTHRTAVTDILKGETIVYFGPEPWTGLWRNRHQLMSRFARDNDVWYVEPPTTPRRLVAGGKHIAGGRHRSRLYSRDPSGVNIFHSPWWLPITGRRPLKDISLRLYLALLSLTARLRKKRPIIWVSRPDMIDYLDGLATKLTIYHVVDEYSGYGSRSAEQRQVLIDREAELLRRVDVVIVVTPTLLSAKSAHNPNTHLVPNAVDFDAYAGDRAATPPDLAGIPEPVIGYSGLISERLDLDLLLSAARSRPDWSYVFVGFVREDGCREQVRGLDALPNVHFLGQKPVFEAPAYVRHFSVGIIPYADNIRARHASPLKLYEYSAASKPIVATDFPAARDFEGHVEIIRDRDEFLTACERCLAATPQTDAVRENQRFAANNTWEQRIEQISDIVRTNMKPDARLGGVR